MKRTNRPLGEVKSVENYQVVALHVEMVEESHEIALALGTLACFGHEYGLLESAGRSGEILIFDARVPVVVADDVPEASRRRSALLDIVVARLVRLQLPKMAISLRHETVVDAGEFAIGPVELEGSDASICGTLWVKYPAEGI